MKKAFFISLSAIILLGLIVFFIEMATRQKADESELSLQYLSNKISADYARDTVRIYMPIFLRASGKPALNATTYAPLPVDVPKYMTELMRSGSYMGQTINENLTIKSLINRTLGTIYANVSISAINFTVVSVNQPNPWTIEFLTEVNLTILSGDVKWNDSLTYTTMLDVNSLYNAYNVPHNPNIVSTIQREFWEVNNSAECYLAKIHSGYLCNGVPGISWI